ncbi:LLM class F420-dependent oxidoreductase [Actinomadura sp. 7K534]|uniref:LLM class F420-dependent oxidoreductase n=1 Tax=Actinomadura sp. 7K534 TaxID=2530366 RepID=UPI00104E779C|nr:LLM class F420-dependent oxidoreductase [Actinomadura sp. 7K534]TDB98198.1 LLM class F420-dependent oxidoreductase [Actinomadura sp. 7K534]
MEAGTRRIGLTLPIGEEPLGELPGILADAAAAGYTDVWTSELTAADAFAPLTVAALSRPGLRVGTSIAGVFSRSPALLAMQALGLAELSAAPIRLGIGTSSENMVTRWHGAEFERPYSRMRDTIRFLRRAFEGERVTFASDTIRIDGFRLGRTPPHRPRILVAALRERMLRLAGAEGDGVILNWLSADDVRTVLPFVLDANPGAEVVGRLFTVCAEDAGAARDLARPLVAAYLSTGVYGAYHRWLGRGPALEAMWRAWRAGDRRAAVAAVPDAVIDELFLTGTEEDVRAGIAAYTDAGVTVPVVSVIGTDPAAVRRRALALGAPSGA